MKQILSILILLLIFAAPITYAAIDFDQGLSDDEEQQVDQILQPVMKVYNAFKYAATVVAVLVLVFAGFTFLTAGGENAKKDRAKNMAAGVVIGLIVIWVAPLIVKYVFS